ncbi:MAG TPA: hypothetical protein VN132_05015 [Bdellovibrio sp.]|nr:hypothetical protein [Bdellovibrio sp.]
MKKIIAIFCLVSVSSTVFAVCPKADVLKKQVTGFDVESTKLGTVADYLESRFKEPNGPYSHSQDVGVLMLETRNKSLEFSIQAAKLRIRISEELLSCVQSER